MPSYTLRGVDVEFPYDAYACQLDYMSSVIEALQNSKNALLESPTGTGKTLCLLCATLAWRESVKRDITAAPEKLRSEEQQSGFLVQGLKEAYAEYKAERVSQGDDLPTIIYSSRTHSQLKQVMGELAATSYKPRTSVLGSRQQSCLNPDVQPLPSGAANQACRSLVSKNRCKWAFGVEKYMKQNPNVNEKVMDIEDLARHGKNRTLCPYFLSREMAANADIVFMPYNYLVDPMTRNGLGINWDNAVLIFDEAHNVEAVCCEAASFDLPANLVAAAIEEAGTAAELAQSRADSAPRNVADAFGNLGDGGSAWMSQSVSIKQLQLVLQKFEQEIATMASRCTVNKGITLPGKGLFDLLAKINLTEETWSELSVVMDLATGILTDEAVNGGRRSGAKASSYRLHALRDALSDAFMTRKTPRQGSPPLYEGYRVHVHLQRPGWGNNSNSNQGGGSGHFGGSEANRPVPTLSYWCFSPAQAMSALSDMKIRSIVLTSGTLSPLGSFAAELGIPFDVRLENPHVIDPTQAWIGVVTKGPQGQALNSSYQNRDNRAYREDLGNAIVNFARIVPDGLLVFFPSYTVLRSSIESWKTITSGGASLWERICQYKAPVIEPKEASNFPAAAEDFRKKLEAPQYSGAIFFAVCRGKASEGLDFSDRAGRAVIITGIPYATTVDPKVQIKQDVLNEALRNANRLRQPGAKNSSSNGGNTDSSSVCEREEGLSGDAWYVQQAMRAVNQAMGRVIRHRRDYGAIILCDERLSRDRTKGQLSKWLRDQVVVHQSYGSAASSLTKFFKDLGMKEREGIVGGSEKRGMLIGASRYPGNRGSGFGSSGTAATAAAAAGGQHVSAFQIAAKHHPVQQSAPVLHYQQQQQQQQGVSIRPLVSAAPAAMDVVGVGQLISGVVRPGTNTAEETMAQGGKKLGLLNILGGGGASTATAREQRAAKTSRGDVNPPGRTEGRVAAVPSGISQAKGGLDALFDDLGNASGHKILPQQQQQQQPPRPSFGLGTKPWERPLLAESRLQRPITASSRKASLTAPGSLPSDARANVVGPVHRIAQHQERQKQQSQAIDIEEANAKRTSTSMLVGLRKKSPPPAVIVETHTGVANEEPRGGPHGHGYGDRHPGGVAKKMRLSADAATQPEKESRLPGGKPPATDFIEALKSGLPPDSATRMFNALRDYRKGGSVDALISVAAAELYRPERKSLLEAFRAMVPKSKQSDFEVKIALATKRFVGPKTAAQHAKPLPLPPPQPPQHLTAVSSGHRSNQPARRALLPKHPQLKSVQGKAEAAHNGPGENSRPAVSTPACSMCGKAPMEAPHTSSCCGKMACYGCWLKGVALRACPACRKPLKKGMLSKKHFM